MIQIKDGAVNVAFKIDGKDVVRSISLADVPGFKVEDLALLALAKVSRETMAGVQDDHPKALKKLDSRWEGWKRGIWGAERQAAAKLTEQEVAEQVLAYFEFFLIARGFKTKEAAAMVKAVVAKDETALAKFTPWMQLEETKEAVAKRCKEVLKLRKSKVAF